MYSVLGAQLVDCQRRHRRRWLYAALACATMGVPQASAQTANYISKVRVTDATQLDWEYPLVGESQQDPQALLADYKSTAQSYEFFGPKPSQAAAFPLVIFISPSDRPVGWPFWEATCRSRGVLFAGLRDMGNGRPAAHRVRAVLDVVDDVRQQFPVDPDRTYLAGFSGGAYIACTVALALPEHFGGVVCVGHAPLAPRQPWVSERVRDRLSAALLCGDRDPAAPTIEHLVGPWWSGLGMRVETVLLRGCGHTMPDADVFDAAFEWLEGGVAARRTLAARRPSTRIAEALPAGRWAELVLADARHQLSTSDPEDISSALLQLEGLVKRWPESKAADDGQLLLDDYGSRPGRPWENLRRVANIQSLELQAEGYEALAFDGRTAAKPDRGRHAEIAIALLNDLRQRAGDDEEVATIDERISALEKLVAAAPARAKVLPLQRVRFEMNGDVTLAEGIEYVRAAVARLGYTVEVDEAALKAAGVDFEKVHRLKLRAVTFTDIDRRFFRRSGVMTQRKDGVITIVPLPAKSAAAPVNRARPSASAR